MRVRTGWFESQVYMDRSSVSHQCPSLNLAIPVSGELTQRTSSFASPQALTHVRSSTVAIQPCGPLLPLLRPLLTACYSKAVGLSATRRDLTGKNAPLHRSTVTSKPSAQERMVCCPISLLGSAFYVVFVDRLAKKNPPRCRSGFLDF